MSFSIQLQKGSMKDTKRFECDVNEADMVYQENLSIVQLPIQNYKFIQHLHQSQLLDQDMKEEISEDSMRSKNIKSIADSETKKMKGDRLGLSNGFEWKKEVTRSPCVKLPLTRLSIPPISKNRVKPQLNISIPKKPCQCHDSPTISTHKTPKIMKMKNSVMSNASPGKGRNTSPFSSFIPVFGFDFSHHQSSEKCANESFRDGPEEDDDLSKYELDTVKDYKKILTENKHFMEFVESKLALDIQRNSTNSINSTKKGPIKMKDRSPVIELIKCGDPDFQDDMAHKTK